jgi:protein TonB
MKKFLFLLMSLMPLLASAQKLVEKDPTTPDVFINVEEMPEFPGGNGEMYAFLAKHIRYPEDARMAKAQGKVYITFVVNEKGKVTQPKVLKPLHPSLDKEALRVMEIMPAWKPGMQDGKAVRVKMTLPVQFKLD